MAEKMNMFEDNKVRSNYNSLIVQNHQLNTARRSNPNRERSQQMRKKKVSEYVKTVEDEPTNPNKCLNNSEQSSILNQTFVNNFTFTFKLKDEEEETHNYSTFVSPSQLENKSPHKNQSNEQILIQRIKEKEQLLQQLQNYYRDLSRNYEESRNKFIQKINQQEEQLELKDRKIREQKEIIRDLEVRNKVLQSNIEFDRTNTLNMNSLMSSNMMSNNNLMSSNMMSNKSTLSFNSNKSKNSLGNSVLISNEAEQYGYKQLMTQFVSNFNINMENVHQNDSQQYLSNQIYTLSKEIKHFRQFYHNIFGIIRDCQQKELEVQNTKQGLKYIWKWIKGILDSLIKAKLSNSTYQTR